MRTADPEKEFQRLAARCALGEHCRGELVAKMRQRGLTAEDAEKVAERLESEGYINDSRYARAFAHDKHLYDHWGRTKIRLALLQKGIGRSDIDNALSLIDDEGYSASLRSLLAQKSRSLKADDDYTRRQKLARFALQRGFEPELVFSLLDVSCD